MVNAISGTSFTHQGHPAMKWKKKLNGEDYEFWCYWMSQSSLWVFTVKWIGQDDVIVIEPNDQYGSNDHKLMFHHYDTIVANYRDSENDGDNIKLLFENTN